MAIQAGQFVQHRLTMRCRNRAFGQPLFNTEQVLVGPVMFDVIPDGA